MDIDCDGECPCPGTRECLRTCGGGWEIAHLYTIHAYITPLTDQHSYRIDDSTFTSLHFTSKGRPCPRPRHAQKGRPRPRARHAQHAHAQHAHAHAHPRRPRSRPSRRLPAQIFSAHLASTARMHSACPPRAAPTATSTPSRASATARAPAWPSRPSRPAQQFAAHVASTARMDSACAPCAATVASGGECLNGRDEKHPERKTETRNTRLSLARR